MDCFRFENMDIWKDAISMSRLDSIEKLVSINGFGEQKIAKFGEEIIAFINSF